ncbi:MAG: hypothetical protein QM537_06695 [Candidatus Symbiobacter sp.]|nr:hypothetical protein [Candidatus Symbiobacter sp.]
MKFLAKIRNIISFIGLRFVITLGGFAAQSGAEAVAKTAATTAAAAPRQLVISYQYDMADLPLFVMQDKQLVEKRAAALGLNLSIDYASVPDESVAESIKSGVVQIAVSGVSVFAQIWAATSGPSDQKVKGISAISSFPFYLTSSNPAIKSIRDFTESDRIAILDTEYSLPSELLKLYQEEVFGPGKYDHLRKILLPISTQEGVNALLRRRYGVNAHFVLMPYALHELENPKIRLIYSTEYLWGGLTTTAMAYSTSKFHDNNPKIILAFNQALADAFSIIKNDPSAALASYRKNAVDSLPVDLMLKTLQDPKIQFTAQFNNVMKIIEFRAKRGAIHKKPQHAKEVFFGEDNIKNGS